MMEKDKRENGFSRNRTKMSSTAVMSKKQIIKNIIIVCVTVLINGISISTLLMLQSTVNKKDGIGLIGQAILYATSCPCSLIFSKYILKKYGSKKSLILSMLTNFPYIAANCYPEWELMIPASILLGIGAPIYWSSQGTYLSDISLMLAEVIIKSKEKIISFEANSTKTGEISSSFLNVAEPNGGKKDERDFNESNEVDGIVSICEESNQIEKESWDKSNKFLKTKDELKVKYVEPLDSSKTSITNNTKTDFSESNKIDGVVSTFEESNQIEEESWEKSIEFIKPKDEYKVESVELLDSSRTAMIVKGTKLAPIEESSAKNKTFESITARVFGIHGMGWMSSTLFGHCISFLIFQHANVTFKNATNTICACGSNYCPSNSTCISDYAREITNIERYSLMSVFATLTLVALALIIFFLDPVGTFPKNKVFSNEDFICTFKFAKRVDALFLMPLTFYGGMIQGFFYGDFTKEFVDCSLGLNYVSLVLACFSLFSTISSTVSGWLVKSLGRKPVFSVLALLNALAIVILLFWIPNPNETVMYFVMAAMFGICVGITWSQTRALYGVFFKADEDAAFSTLYLWYSLGYFTSFLYSKYICTLIKIYMILVVSTLAFTGYLLAERKYALKRF